MSLIFENKSVAGVVWSAIERFSVQGIQFILGIVIARLINPSDYGLIAMLGIFLAIAQTFTDSGFSASTTLEEIRGGFSDALQSMYAHTSAFEVTAKDCLVDLDYIAAQVGGNVSAGGDVFITESVTTTVANKITVVGTPKG